jgi:hypothetical protein
VSRLVVVGCGAAKQGVPSPARELYVGPLFKAAREYAEASGDAWVIMSAKYGLVQPDHVIAPYDLRIEDSRGELYARGEPSLYTSLSSYDDMVAAQLDERALAAMAGLDPLREIEMHAGQAYVDALRWALGGSIGAATIQLVDPLRGLQIGERLGWYRRHRVKLYAVDRTIGLHTIEPTLYEGTTTSTTLCRTDTCEHRLEHVLIAAKARVIVDAWVSAPCSHGIACFHGPQGRVVAELWWDVEGEPALRAYLRGQREDNGTCERILDALTRSSS